MKTKISPKIKEAKIFDYTNFDADKCNNGGCYGFTTTYSYAGDGEYEVSHSTTAEFTFCPFCGSFNSGSCCDGPRFVTEQKVWDEIKNAEKSPHPEYSAEYELFESDAHEWAEKLRRRVRDALNKTANEAIIIQCAIALDVKLD